MMAYQTQMYIAGTAWLAAWGLWSNVDDWRVTCDANPLACQGLDCLKIGLAAIPE